MRPFGLLLLLVMLAATQAACQRPQTGVTVLSYASPYSPSHPFSRADQVWIDWVQSHSRGRLRIHPFWSATLISSDESMTELRHGVADIALITPIYERGGEQLIRAQAGFYAGVQTIDEQIAVYECLARTFAPMRDELHGLQVLALQGGALPGVLTRTRAVRTLADLRGLRIRAPSELLGVLKDLGAAPVNMPMDQVYSQLAKGVLDGVVAPPDTLRALHFSEVARFYWEIAIPRGAYPARAISERRWRTLTPEEQALLTASKPVWEAAIAREVESSVRAGMQFGAQQGVIFAPASADEQREFNALYERDEARSAQRLQRYGIDGPAVLRYAQRLIADRDATGHVRCPITGEAANAAGLPGTDGVAAPSAP